MGTVYPPDTAFMTFGTVRPRTRARNGTKVLPGGVQAGAYQCATGRQGAVECGPGRLELWAVRQGTAGTWARVASAPAPVLAPLRLGVSGRGGRQATSSSASSNCEAYSSW